MIEVIEWIKESRDTRTKHLNLSLPCIERGGNSTNHKGVLAEYLNTTIPSGRILLCHACHNGKCSNAKHLYWGTDKENIADAKMAGTWKNAWENLVNKHGYEEACKINSHKMRENNNGAGNKGNPKSEEHKRKIAETINSL
jgi:hypothetical protein